MTLCSTCGNENVDGCRKCRFCEAELACAEEEIREAAIVHRTVNLKRGRPFVETALKKMENELTQAKSENVKVVTLIHGYGSSGKGGRIRVECRKLLDHMTQKGLIRKVLAGEHFNRREGNGKDLIRRFSGLEKHCTTDFNNPGVTIVEL